MPTHMSSSTPKPTPCLAAVFDAAVAGERAKPRRRRRLRPVAGRRDRRADHRRPHHRLRVPEVSVLIDSSRRCSTVCTTTRRARRPTPTPPRRTYPADVLRRRHHPHRPQRRRRPARRRSGPPPGHPRATPGPASHLRDVRASGLCGAVRGLSDPSRRLVGPPRRHEPRQSASALRAHHHHVHEGGWTLTLKPDRTITLHRPDGTLAYEGNNHRRGATTTTTTGGGVISSRRAAPCR